MIVNCGMMTIARAAHVGGNAFALGEDLNGPRRHPHFDSGARVAIEHRVKMLFDLDMIIEPDARTAPLRQDIGLGRQRLEQRRIQLF